MSGSGSGKLRIHCKCGDARVPDVVTGFCYRCRRPYRPARIPLGIVDVINAGITEPTRLGPVPKDGGSREVLHRAEDIVLPRRVWADLIREPSEETDPTALSSELEGEEGEG